MYAEPQQSSSAAGLRVDHRIAATLAIFALLVFASTAQLIPNGHKSPYTTDVGEIQNALPRWGTLHFSGYPQYSFLGSSFVSLLRPLGVPPAAGASLFSAVWAAATVALLYLVARALRAPRWSAVGASLLLAVHKSFWVDASIAEVHTMTMALVMACLYLAIRYAQSGSRLHLWLLWLLFCHAVVHQRAAILLAPSILIITAPRIREAAREWLGLLALGLTAPLTYLYLPIRDWMGNSWSFSSPGTWEGLCAIVLDNKAERLVRTPVALPEWAARVTSAWDKACGIDCWPLLLLGAAGLALLWVRGNRRVSLSLCLFGVLNAILAMLIWEGGVSDAQLASLLPAALPLFLGVSVLPLGFQRKRIRVVLQIGIVVIVALSAAAHRPIVLAITRDTTVLNAVECARWLEDPATPTTLVVPWGHEYWALRYQQQYEGILGGVRIVDHNADLGSFAQTDRIVTLDDILYAHPTEWWEDHLGAAYLSSAAPGLVAIAQSPARPTASSSSGFDMGNGVQAREAAAELADDQCVVRLVWSVQESIEVDYAVAVHLVSQLPVQNASSILTQADAQHPVRGWRPTSTWEPGELTADHYTLQIPLGSTPVAVRVALYELSPSGEFLNSNWLELPLRKSD